MRRLVSPLIQAILVTKTARCSVTKPKAYRVLKTVNIIKPQVSVYDILPLGLRVSRSDVWSSK